MIRFLPWLAIASSTFLMGCPDPTSSGKDVDTLVETDDPDFNEPPVANDQELIVQEDEFVDLVLEGEDAEGDALTFTVVDAPLRGSLEGEAPDLVYVPDADEFGDDWFTFLVSDGVADSTLGTVNIEIVAVEDAPTIDSPLSFMTDEDTSVAVTLEAADPDGDGVNFTVLEQPTLGTLQGTAPFLIYVPFADANGEDHFTFVADDGLLESDVGEVELTVLPVNDVPTVSAFSDATVSDTSLVVTLVGEDVDGDELEWEITVEPTAGTLDGTAPDLIYTSSPGFDGEDTFSFRAFDGTAWSDEATGTIAVVAANSAPVAASFTVETDEDVPVVVTLLATDVDGDPLTYIILGDPDHGELVGTAPSLQFEPDLNWSGQDQFSYQVFDGTEWSSLAIVTLEVASVNDVPVALEQFITVPEETSATINLSATDADGDSLDFDVVDYPDHGFLTGLAPEVVYLPSQNFVGEDTFTYVADDGLETSFEATVTITVTPVNDIPLAQDTSMVVSEDTPTLVTFAGSDPDGDDLEYQIMSLPGSGSMAQALDGSWTYQPNLNVVGEDSFTYLAFDGQLSSAIATVSVTIQPVNDAPVAAAMALATEEDTAVSFVLTASDVDGDSLTFELVDVPENGQLSGTPPLMTYTPDLNFSGLDVFTFQASDGMVVSSPATVTLSVSGVNDVPNALDVVVVGAEDLPTPITLSGTDSDGDPLTFEVLSSPAHGSLSGTEPNLTFSPDADWNGIDTFTYRVNDGASDSTPGTVTLELSPVNDAPEVISLAVGTVSDEDVEIELVAIDIDGDVLTWILVEAPVEGELTGVLPNVTYVPNGSFVGTDGFTVLVNDGTVDSEPVEISVAVGVGNYPPTALDLAVATAEDTELPITLSASDPDSDPLTYAIVSDPVHGMLEGSGANRTYSPAPDWSGVDQFTFRVSDGALDSNVATVTVTVDAVNDAPVAQAAALSTSEDVPVSLVLVGTDPEGDAISYTVVSSPLFGSLEGQVPNVTYVPNPNFFGVDTFDFRVNDGGRDSELATITITVTAVNDEPMADATLWSTQEDMAVAITLTGSDVEGQALGFTLVDTPAHGSLTGVAPNIVYSPDADWSGDDTFTFQVSDGVLSSLPATVVVSVAPINDAPVAASQTVFGEEDSPESIILSAADVDGDVLTYTLVTLPSYGELTGTPPVVTYSPAANWNGGDSFSFQVSDGLSTDQATVVLEWAPKNDAPEASDVAVSTPEDTSLLINLPGSDIDGDALTWSVLTNPAHGALAGTAPNLTYTPDLDYVGADAFDFRLSDGLANSPQYTVNITVDAVGDEPVALSDWLTVDEDSSVAVLLAGTDPDGDSLTFTVTVPPAFGTLSGVSPNLVYSPDQDFVGSDELWFTASDGDLVSAPASIAFTVNSVNDAPVAADLSVSTDEDIAVEIDITAFDVDGDAMFYVVNDPQNGTLSGAYPNVTYLPDLNFVGIDTFTYTASDGSETSQLATVTIDVGGVNDAPTVTDASYDLDEDTSIEVTLAGSDSDGDPLTYTLVSLPSQGLLMQVANDTLVYEAATDSHGTFSATYRASDGSADSNLGTLTFVVAPVPDAPVAYAQEVNVEEDGSVGVGLTASDADGDVIQLAISVSPAHGTLGGSPPLLSYTPDPDFNGVDTFVFSASDGSLSDTATVTVIVSPVNDPPVALGASYTVDEDDSIQLELDGVDVDGDSVVAIVQVQPSHGTYQANGLYTPDPDYFGPDSLSFVVQDGLSTSQVAEILLEVEPVQDAPTAPDLTGVSIYEDSSLELLMPAVDVDGDDLVYTMDSSPSGGLAYFNGANLIYEADPDWNGTDEFSYLIDDGFGNVVVGYATIIVTAVNDAPTVSTMSTTVAEDGSVAFTLTADDVDEDVLSWTVAQPGHGVLVGVAPNLTYIPDADFNGEDSFVFSVSDGSLNSGLAVMYLTVESVNDAPVASALEIATEEGVAVSFELVASDVDGDALTYVITTQPYGGTLSGVPPEVTYTPALGFAGEDFLVWYAKDDSDSSEVVTVSIYVEGNNESPVAVDDVYSVVGNYDNEVLSAEGVILNDADPDNDALEVVAQSGLTVLGGLYVINDQGGFTYTPPRGVSQVTDSFDYTVFDSSGAADSAIVYLQLDQLIWFVDNQAQQGGLGTYSDPFSHLSSAGEYAASGDWIYVHRGTGTSANYDEGVSLDDNVTLIGSGVVLAYDGVTLLPAGSAPVLVGRNGSAVYGTGDLSVRGIIIDASDGDGIVSNGVTTITDVSIEQADGTGISVVGGDYVYMSDVSAKNTSGDGIRLTDVNKSELYSITITDSGQQGAAGESGIHVIRPGSQFTLSGCLIDKAMGDSVFVEGDGHLSDLDMYVGYCDFFGDGQSFSKTLNGLNVYLSGAGSLNLVGESLNFNGMAADGIHLSLDKTTGLESGNSMSFTDTKVTDFNNFGVYLGLRGETQNEVTLAGMTVSGGLSSGGFASPDSGVFVEAGDYSVSNVNLEESSIDDVRSDAVRITTLGDSKVAATVQYNILGGGAGTGRGVDVLHEGAETKVWVLDNTLVKTSGIVMNHHGAGDSLFQAEISRNASDDVFSFSTFPGNQAVMELVGNIMQGQTLYGTDGENLRDRNNTTNQGPPEVSVASGLGLFIIGEGVLTNYEIGTGGTVTTCAAGQIEDCQGVCYSAAWVGDGYCDDGRVMSWGDPDFYCDELEHDGGDCDEILALESGETHACALNEVGSVTCWGTDGMGEISGNPGGRFTDIGVHLQLTCGVTESQEVTCWGSDLYGRVSGAPTTGEFTDVTVGIRHACAKYTNDLVTCWGDDSYGQVSELPTQSLTMLDAGGYHNCGLLEDGTVACGGRDDFGQTSNTPQGFYSKVSSGAVHSCAMSSVGDLVCWGSNTYGQSSVPTEVFSDVSSGGFHTCGITNSGAVLCWGYDFFGQVSNTPQGNNYTKVSAGEYSTCAVTTTDSIECWGRDSSGQASPPVFPLTP